MFSLSPKSSVGLLAYTCAALAQPYTSWKDYGGAPDSMQYSALRQINKTNVARLELAWSHVAPGTSGMVLQIGARSGPNTFVYYQELSIPPNTRTLVIRQPT